MSDQPLKLCVAAKAVIVNDAGNVLILRESGAHDTNTRVGRYQLPGGRIEAGEQLFEGLRREVMEETGLTIDIGQPLLAGEWRPVIKGVQHQIIGMFFVCAADTDNVRLSEEHDKVLWIDPKTRTRYDIVEPDWEAVDAYLRLFV